MSGATATAMLTLLPAVSTEASLQEVADRVTDAYKKSVASIVAVGQLLIDAKAATAHGGFARLFRDNI